MKSSLSNQLLNAVISNASPGLTVTLVSAGDGWDFLREGVEFFLKVPMSHLKLPTFLRLHIYSLPLYGIWSRRETLKWMGKKAGVVHQLPSSYPGLTITYVMLGRHAQLFTLRRLRQQSRRTLRPGLHNLPVCSPSSVHVLVRSLFLSNALLQ